MTVRSHSHFVVSWNCHKLAGDANTQNYEKVGVQFTAVTWKETEIHTPTRTFERNSQFEFFLPAASDGVK
jgi:hypothetical protein